jgi:hypothetical protein
VVVFFAVVTDGEHDYGRFVDHFEKNVISSWAERHDEFTQQRTIRGKSCSIIRAFSMPLMARSARSGLRSTRKSEGRPRSS